MYVCMYIYIYIYTCILRYYISAYIDYLCRVLRILHVTYYSPHIICGAYVVRIAHLACTSVNHCAPYAHSVHSRELHAVLGQRAT